MNKIFEWMRSKFVYWKLRFIFILKMKQLCRRYYKNNQKIPADKKFYKEYSARWKYLSRFMSRDWIDWGASISRVKNIDQVSEDIYVSIIEPILNNKRMALAYADKNLYDKIFEAGVFPKVLYRNINGTAYDSKYQRVCQPFEGLGCSDSSVIVKPSLESGGGRNIEIFFLGNDGQYRSSTGAVLNSEYLLKHYKKNYIVQQVLQQHSFFSKLNSSSVNTLRVLTYRSVKTDDVHVLGSVLRIGKAGASVDNQSSGGMACALDSRGVPHEYGTDFDGNKLYALESGILLKDIGPVLNYFEMTELARKIAAQLPYFRILGIDICLDSEGRARALEVNPSFIAVTFHQTSGNSMLGGFTDEIIEYCGKEMRQRPIRYK